MAHDNHAHDHAAGGESHGSVKSYLIGFVLAVVLTVIPFWMVMSGDFSQWLGAGTPGDYNDDGVLDAKDIDLQAVEMKLPQEEQNTDLFDHNDDNRVKQADRSIWVKQLRKTWVGDANLDNEFNSGDLVAVFSAGN